MCIAVIVFAGAVSATIDASGLDAETVAADGNIQELLVLDGVRGGLVVHAGSSDRGKQAALALDAGEAIIVQGINEHADHVERAQRRAESLGLSGRLTFRQWDGRFLPYADNLVTALFWELPPEAADMAEIMRVLSPGGTAYVKHADGWRKAVKPRPDEIDEWPHHRYNAGNTGTSRDTRVGPPAHIQWEAGPRVMRSHEIETGLTNFVTANGRIYYILDEGPIGITDARFPAQWSLVCRDAFNGIQLWKRPLPGWGWQAWKEARTNNPHEWLGQRTHPADVDRLMVVDGDTLYVTLGWGKPISAIDGKRGDVIQTYDATQGTVEFVVYNSVLLVRTENDRPAIAAIDPETGDVRWHHEAPIIADRSLCAANGRVFYHTRREMISVDLESGEELWRTDTEIRPGGVIAHEDVVLAIVSGVTLALSAETGEIVWKGPGAGARGRQPDMFVVEDTVWYGRPDFHARCVRTGEKLREMQLQKVLESGHHRRCYTDRATLNYMITGERGSEFLDFHDDEHKRLIWFRGPCITGMTPANGLFYVPPHQCFCYPAVRMDGFFALAAQSDGPSGGGGSAPRLEEGPAYGESAEDGAIHAGDWPMYRRDPRRSGATAEHTPAELERRWSVSFGGDLTQAVVANGRVFVVRKGAGMLYCLDFDSGDVLWRRSVAGRIDSPPVIHDGFAYFGARDGHVYSLRASDGALAWRFRAAPEDRQIVSYGRLESAWPVHGSVLLFDGLLYCTAGRSGFVDGGIYLYALDPLTGEVVHENTLEGPYPDISEPSEAFHKDGYRADLLTTDGEYVYMGRTAFERNLEEAEVERIALVGTQRGDNLEYRIMPGMRLVATGGFLNDTFWNRTWWMHSRVWPGFHYAQQAPKSGQMLVFDDERVFTVKHYTTRNRHSPMFFPGDGYLLFADDIGNEPLFYRGEGEPKPIEWEPELPEETRWTIYQDAAVDKGPGFTRAQPALWTSWVDVRIEAMTLAGDNLFVAGTPDLAPMDDPVAALEGRMGGVLQVVSASDGSPIAEYRLGAGPAFDGLIAANGRLIMTTRDGAVVCMSASEAAPQIASTRKTEK